MWPLIVVVDKVLAENVSEMALRGDQHPVEAFPTAAPDPPLRASIGARREQGCQHLWGARKSIEFRQRGLAVVPEGGPEPVLSVAVVPGLLYSLVPGLLTRLRTTQRDQTKVQAEVPALRRHV
jgi:hypothetical protein